MKVRPIKVKKGGCAAAERPAPPSRWNWLPTRESAALGGIVALTALVYLRCLANGYVFDDHEMITVNRFIGEWSFLWKALINDSWWFRDPTHLPQSHYYRPLQDIWLGLNYQVFGPNPVGPHALMVGLHLVAVLSAYQVAVRLTADRVAGLVAALLFGLLPVHAEAVIWATAVPESLAGTLQLGAFYFYLRYRDAHSNYALAWSLAMFGGALLSHESAIAFPLLVAVHAFVFASSHPNSGQGKGEASAGYLSGMREAFGIAAPYIGLAVLYLGLRLAVLGFIAKRDVNNRATLAQIVLTVPSVIVHNLADIIIPWQAGPSHRVIWASSLWEADFWMPAVGLCLIAAAGLMALAGSPRRKVYFFATAWVLIAMAPMLNLGILYPNALVADRYLYFSSFGFCLMAGQGAAALRHSYHELERPLAALVGLAALVYGLTLWQVQHFWHDEIALFGRCLERFPESGFCHNRLGMALQAVGDLTGAERELAIAMKLDVHDYAAEYDLAMVHAQQQRYAQAAREAADALRHLPNAPASAYISLAQLYDAAEDPAASEAAFARAETLPGGGFDTVLARAQLKLGHKDGPGAEQQLKPILGVAPDDPRALLMLGSAMALQKRYNDALAAYEHASRVVPANLTVRFLIALTLHNLGRNREALEQCRLVLQRAPTDPNARSLLALLQRDLQSSPHPNHGLAEGVQSGP
ncbi:MAG TPA: tetratricopeptide repeat protein [Candidatus Binataceae bacterium]|nr:tetratricopeptide repeat protein [Candidatus Binataceae bacterium]